MHQLYQHQRAFPDLGGWTVYIKDGLYVNEPVNFEAAGEREGSLFTMKSFIVDQMVWFQLPRFGKGRGVKVRKWV